MNSPARRNELAGDAPPLFFSAPKNCVAARLKPETPGKSLFVEAGPAKSYKLAMSLAARQLQIHQGV